MYSQSLDFVYSSIGFQWKYLQLKASRDEFQNNFHVWVSTRKQTRKLGKEPETVSPLERVNEQRAVPVGLPPWSTLYNTLVRGAATVVETATTVVATGTIWNAIAGRGEKGLITQKIADVHEAIREEMHALRELQSSLCLLEDCVADFAVFCRDHIDLVLSSELVNSEFRFLLYVLRGAYSPGAAARVSLSRLVDIERDIHIANVITLMNRLERSTSNQELLSTIQQILDKLPEGPNDEEIPTMIMNFIEAKFTEACKS